MSSPVRVERRAGGAWRHICLARPPGNVLDLKLLRGVRRALEEGHDDAAIKLVTLGGDGAHFSYGASIEEHRAPLIHRALHELHAVIRALLGTPAPTAAIVRGRCLGGGFELALACDVIFAAADAAMGLPEIRLGVIPPAGAALLPLRVAPARAARAVFGGEAMPAAVWAGDGLVEVVDPSDGLDERVAAWFETDLAPRSAVALRWAALAGRTAFKSLALAALAETERLYLDRVLESEDATEGLEAFLEKRQPRWRNR